jgi:hypothetical protein
VAAETLLEGEAEAITRKAIELAKQGDGPALRLCMDRIYPARKDRPVRFRLPPLEKVGDAVAANAALVGVVASGELTPSEAGQPAKLVIGRPVLFATSGASGVLSSAPHDLGHKAGALPPVELKESAPHKLSLTIGAHRTLL